MVRLLAKRKWTKTVRQTFKINYTWKYSDEFWPENSHAVLEQNTKFMQQRNW